MVDSLCVRLRYSDFAADEQSTTTLLGHLNNDDAAKELKTLAVETSKLLHRRLDEPVILDLVELTIIDSNEPSIPPPQRVLTRRDGVCYRVDRQHKHQHLRSRCQYGMNTSPHYVHWGPRDRLDDELAFPPPVSLTCLPGCCFLFSSFSKSNPPRVARNCCRHAKFP